jgi:uncharacterized protein YkwD
VLLLSACAGSNSTSDQAVFGMTEAWSAQLPSVGELTERSVSAAGTFVRLGSHFEAGPNRVVADGQTAVFTPQFADSLETAAWAVYRFNLTDYAGEASLQLIWETAPLADCWLAVSDFANSSWELGALSDPAQFDFESLSPYTKPDGTLFVALILCTQTEARLKALRFGPSLAPVAVLSLSPESGSAPLSITMDGGGSFSIGGQIDAFSWDTDGDGSFEEETGGTSTIQILFDRLPATYTLGLRVLDSQGRETEAWTTVTVTGTQFTVPPTEEFVDFAPEADVEYKWQKNCYATLPPWQDENRAFQSVYFLQEANELLSMVNSDRALLSAEPLVWDAHLELAAQAHARHMGMVDFFDYLNPYGQSVYDRLALINVIPWSTAGELITAGYNTAEEAFALFKADEDLYNSLMNPDQSHVGIGVYHAASSIYGTYWEVVLIGGIIGDPQTHDWLEPHEVP